MYMEVSGNFKPGDSGGLLSPRFPSTKGSCLRFYYHMYGSHIGTLNVYLKLGFWASRKVWSKTGNQTNSWNIAQVGIKSSFSYQVRGWFLIGSQAANQDDRRWRPIRKLNRKKNPLLFCFFFSCATAQYSAVLRCTVRGKNVVDPKPTPYAKFVEHFPLAVATVGQIGCGVDSLHV